jgi:hypothetical protein
MASMDKIKFIFKIWTKLANNVRIRDRSLKVLQYGSQMLLGFYAAKFSAVRHEKRSKLLFDLLLLLCLICMFVGGCSVFKAHKIYSFYIEASLLVVKICESRRNSNWDD